MAKDNFLDTYKRILEYTEIGGDEIEEDDPNAAAGVDPNAAMGGGMDPNAMGGAGPNAAMGDGMDPNTMGGVDPNAAMGGGMDPNAMGGADPNAAPQGPEGFAPQVGDPNAAPMGDMGTNDGSEDTEVIDVDELTDSQEETEKKIDALSGKFERLMGMLDGIETKLADSDRRMEEFAADMEKRNPTPEQKMSLRSQKSGPFTETPEEYWQTKAPDNYSPEDDHNGADMPEYQITKGDLDNFNDWQSISKSFDDERKNMGLHDLLGY